MIHYHGTPVGGGSVDKARFLQGRHALVPFPRQDDMGVVADVCKSFVLDNGAFSVWKRGETLDVPGYMEWVSQWCRHPGFQWALIPDVIDGDESDNARLVRDWEAAGLRHHGVPVWHMHESTERLRTLSEMYPTVALGSSGEWPTPGTEKWWRRIAEAMETVCDKHGRPACKLHGLRMLDPAIFSLLPLASADSTNAAVNCGSVSRFGIYVPSTAAQRAEVIADRIEAHNSSPVWQPVTQESFDLECPA